MNVTIRPLVWSGSEIGGWEAVTPAVRLVVWRANRFETRWIADAEPLGGVFGDGCESVAVIGRAFPSADAAKLAAERWYVAKVLDCLEPADKETAAEFVTLYAQCNGEYDR